MQRRQFLKTTAAGLALSAFGYHAAGTAEQKTFRAGLIGPDGTEKATSGG